MKFTPTPLEGAYIVDIEPFPDARGFFARSVVEQDLKAMGLNTHLLECGVSFNHARGTLRGMHFQLPPYAEVKLIRCTRGAIYDVMVDLRKDSPTYLQWFGVELTADNHRMVYIPEGMAHGYQTLEDKTEVLYQISTVYAPDYSRGYRYDDAAFGIQWPLPASVLSKKDSEWQNFHENPCTIEMLSHVAG